MARLGHGSVISTAQLQEARIAVASLDVDAPLAFAAATIDPLTRYDFLFPEVQADANNLLPESRQTRDALEHLGTTMRESGRADDPSGDSTIPAAYTYLGQFIDHDVTLEGGSSGSAADLVKPDLKPLSLTEINSQVVNVRTATLDLDSVYGIFAPRDPANNNKMEIGVVTSLHGSNVPTLRPRGKDNFNDLPRKPRDPDPDHKEIDREAKIGDPRNDENTIVAQLHVAFLRAHNAIVDQGRTFDKARMLLQQHYQHMVIHDFLKRVADPKIVDDIVTNGNRIYDALREPFFLPLEFSFAAYRFGHSMVRASYNFNLNFNRSGQAGTLPATLFLLFSFTALSGQLGPEQEPTSGTDTLPDNWIIEWERLIGNAANVEKTRRLDTQLVEPLFELRDELGKPLPDNEMRLAVRNLLRGYRLRMPTGQAAAKAAQAKVQSAWQIPTLTPEQISNDAASDERKRALEQGGFSSRTPLWYYLLAEASVLGGGQRLGPLGSTIVAEVLIGLVRRSENSILRDPNWKPSLGNTPGRFDLTDLLRLARVL